MKTYLHGLVLLSEHVLVKNAGQMNFGSILDSQELRHQEQGCSCIQGTVSYEVRQKWIMHNRVYNIMHLVYLSTGMFSLSITLFH